MRKIKNTVLISITVVMIAMFFLSVAAIDSESLLPFVLLIMSFGWLAAFATANGWLDITIGEEEEDCTYHK